MSKWIAIVLVVSIFIVGGLFLRPTYVRREGLKKQNEELAARIKALHVEISRLGDCQRRFRNDPEFVERIAHQNHRIYPDETVFEFSD